MDSILKFPSELFGLILFHELTMEIHVSKTCNSVIYYLYNLIRVRKYLSKDNTKTPVHTFISSRIDYCNSLLYGLMVLKYLLLVGGGGGFLKHREENIQLIQVPLKVHVVTEPNPSANRLDQQISPWNGISRMPFFCCLNLWICILKNQITLLYVCLANSKACLMLDEMHWASMFHIPMLPLGR